MWSEWHNKVVGPWLNYFLPVSPETSNFFLNLSFPNSKTDIFRPWYITGKQLWME